MRNNFGELLTQARQRHNIDLDTAARRLRIRPDILRAIEEGDFARMPPRGYTRNMVNAYARFLGLNPTEITRMYLDAASFYQASYAPQSSRRSTGEGRSYATPNTRVRSSAQARQRQGAQTARNTAATTNTAHASSQTGFQSGLRSRDSVSARERQGSFERKLYDDRRENSPLSFHSAGRVHSAQQSVFADRNYANFYGGPLAPSPWRARLPILIAIAIILILLIVIISLAFGSRGSSTGEQTSTVPITGLSDTSNPTSTTDGAQQSTTTTTTSVAPTKATFTYSVKSGASVYIEVYEGDGGASIAQDVEGPSEQSFDVTTTLKFVMSGNLDDIECSVDGESVTPTESGSSGVYTYTVDFSEILAAWQQENAAASSTSGTSSATDTSGTTGTSSTSGASSSAVSSGTSDTANTSNTTSGTSSSSGGSSSN